MIDPLWKFNLMTSRDMTNAISLQGPGAGRTLSNLQDGIQLDLFGAQASPVNRFRAPDSNEDTKTSDTSGRHSSIWLTSADLQLSLESKLRARMDVNGSPEYKLTLLREWDSIDNRLID